VEKIDTPVSVWLGGTTTYFLITNALSKMTYDAIYNLTEKQVSKVVAYILSEMCCDIQEAIETLIADGLDNGASEDVGVLPEDNNRKLIALYYGECIDKEALDEDEEDDDWMEIYSHHPDFKVFCGDHEHLKPYHGFRYFQCWGGGDEGGFIMNDDDETFKVKRGWGEPFSVEPVDGILDIGHRDGVEQLRVIPENKIKCRMPTVIVKGMYYIRVETETETNYTIFDYDYNEAVKYCKEHNIDTNRIKKCLFD
jgi:hypothetical protein